MDMQPKLFLNTQRTHIECTEILLSELHETMLYLSYNVKRYNVPVTLVMFYSQENIEDLIIDSKRLSDVLKVIKIGEAYFSFVYLLFTDLKGCDTFVEHMEFYKLSNIEYRFAYDQLEAEEEHFYNFINSYLFKIEEESCCS
jgi:hypothetical protein